MALSYNKTIHAFVNKTWNAIFTFKKQKLSNLNRKELLMAAVGTSLNIANLKTNI